MKIVADLHIHSHYSRATSEKMNIDELSHYAKLKGINLLGTGDFTHPLWFKELKQKLEQKEEGIFAVNDMNFILSSEISLIYSQDKKMRKVHLITLSPSFEIAEQINEWLLTKGRLDYDGRPIFGMTCPEFAEKVMEISKDNFIIPAHCMTPWFGIFGSKSGFDSVEECFKDQTKHIYALETGLSADPEMLWRISSLDNYSLVSNSDSHSPWSSRIGRECNVFDFEKLTYKNLINAIKTRDKNRFLYTIEVDPSYGKYHYDGHRNCNISLSPEESKKYNNICPVCKRPLTIGVLHRVEELADRPEGFVLKDAIPFKRLLPLAELIAKKYSTGLFSKKVFEMEKMFIEKFDNELNVLLNADYNELSKTDDKLADAIIRNREGKIKINPGYDGVYGEPLLNDKKKIRKSATEINQNDLKRFLE